MCPRFTRDEGGLDRGRLHHAQQFRGHGLVYQQSAERDAARFTIIQRALTARIAEERVRVASVPDGELPTTPPTSEHPGQERRAGRGSPAPPPAAQGLGHHLLNPLTFPPAHPPPPPPSP